MKTNHYVISGGKLVPKEETIDKRQKNYSYIHYEPRNYVVPNDYMKEKVARLEQENEILRKQLQACSSLNIDSLNLEKYKSEINRYASQVEDLSLEIARLRK